MYKKVFRFYAVIDGRSVTSVKARSFREARSRIEARLSGLGNERVYSSFMLYGLVVRSSGTASVEEDK